MIREFDYSMLSTYMTCQRKFYFRHVKDLTTKTRATALEFGHSIHSALNQWFKTNSVEKMLSAFKQDWDACGGDTIDDSKRTLDKANRILKGYVVKYQQEPFTVLENEKSFELPMAGGLTYIGRKDRLVDWQGAIYVLEHKTSSQLGYSTFDKFKPNMQLDGYIYSARQDRPACHGCVVDVLLVAKTKEDYARKIETRTDEEIALFPGLFNNIALDVQESITNDRWVPNFEACTYYGACPYRTICMQSPQLWDRICSTEYIVSHWDPRTIEVEG
jgi:CRISPR/Cas system-associated exonuclease Cas4 (RecB family)